MRLVALAAALALAVCGPPAAARPGPDLPPASPSCVPIAYGAPNPLRASGRERRIVTQALVAGLDGSAVRHPPVFAFPRETGCAAEAARRSRHRQAQPRGMSGADATLPAAR
jgi:hypothetical protein